VWIEKNGPVYRIRDLVNGKKVTVATGFPNKTIAKNKMAEKRADQLRGEAVLPKGRKTTLAQFVAGWWPQYERSLKPSAAHSEGGRIRNHILPLLGRSTLGELDGNSGAVGDWVDRLIAGDGPMGEGCQTRRKPLAPKTVHNCHGLLYVVLDAAVAAKLIRHNPCASAKQAKYLPHREHREMRFLTDPEVGRLLAALPAHWRPLILLLVATGLRWGEAVALRIGDVDLLARTPRLRVTRTMLEQSSSGDIIFTDPKTKASRRTVSFTVKVAESIAGLVSGRERDELVFLSPQGKAVRTRNFRRVWLRAVERAGLGGVRVHDLRHSHAAMLIAAGRHLTAIQRRLGHSSIAVTSDLYGHLREEVDEGILAAIEASLAGVDLDALEAEVADELVGLAP
jgi:integrase